MQASKMIRKILLFIAASCLGLGTVSAREVVEPVSPVDVVASGYNGHAGGTATKISDPDYALKFAGDATIRLAASAAVEGVFTLYANIFATNGTVIVEAESGISKIRWVGGIECKGVVVKGAKVVEFGDTVTNNSKSETNFTFFGADGFEFEGGEGTFTFVNAVTLTRFPTCAYTIADNTHVGVAAEGLLGDGSAYTLTNFDISLVNDLGIRTDKIVVPSGRYVTVFPCATDFGDEGSAAYNIARWAWGGSSGHTIAYDFELVAGSALGIYGSQVNHTFTGNITGSTALTLGHTASKLPANVNFSGSVDLEGTVTLSNYSSIHCNGDGPFKFGDVTCTAYAEKGNTFTFKKPANGSIGTLTGGIKVVGDANSAFAVGGLAAGARLDVDGAVKVTVGAGDATATVGLLGADGGWTVSGSTDAVTALNLVPETEGCTVNLGGKLALGDLGSKFAVLNLLEGAELSDTSFDAATVITGKGKVVRGGTSWKEKIYLWCDGSKSDSYRLIEDVWDLSGTQVTPIAHIILNDAGYPVVYDWMDCRGEGYDNYRFRSMRCTSAAELNTTDKTCGTYPFFATNVAVSANGKAKGYLSMAGNVPGSRQTSLLRRTNDSWDVGEQATAYAVVVFDSAQGGGAGILGSTKASLARVYSKSAAAAQSNAMFTNRNFTVYADGNQVADSTVTALSGGWQILSIDTEGEKVCGIGMDKRSSSYSTWKDYRGYSNYAEVMLFSEAPTEIERKVIEEQLAEKWGLSCTHSGTVEAVTLNVAVGGTAASVPLVEYAADDIPRAFTLNVSVPQDFKRDVKYPLVKCADSDTVALGTVTGKPVQGLTIIREGGIAYLYAPKIGLVITVK